MGALRHVTVNKDVCVSNLWCVRNLPAVFREDPDGQGEAYDPEGADEQSVLDAVHNCPSGAISVTNASTGEDR
jgi:ferredoxin